MEFMRKKQISCFRMEICETSANNQTGNDLNSVLDSNHLEQILHLLLDLSAMWDMSHIPNPLIHDRNQFPH